MTRSDIGVILTIYLICFLFCYMTLQLKPAAQIYPLCLIAGLAILNTLYLGKCVYKAYLMRQSEGSAFFNDLPEIFKGFLPRQFFFVLFASIAFLALMHYIGFYLASLIYMAGVMLWLKVKPIPIILTILILGALIYGVFTKFLGVPLPVGIFFE